MNATLTFSLPEEQEDHNNAINGYRYRLVLSELDNYLRGKIKHEDEHPLVKNALQEVRDLLYSELDGLPIS